MLQSAWGILGSIIVSVEKIKANSVKMIYISAMLSFMLENITMGIGRGVVLGSFVGFMASFPISFIYAWQMKILYQNIPSDIQGRNFSIRNVIQFSTIPYRHFAWRFLVDYAFEPFMMLDVPIIRLLKILVGECAGSGMAVMFLCTGILETAFSFIFYKLFVIRNVLIDT